MSASDFYLVHVGMKKMEGVTPTSLTNVVVFQIIPRKMLLVSSGADLAFQRCHTVTFSESSYILCICIILHRMMDPKQHRHAAILLYFQDLSGVLNADPSVSGSKQFSWKHQQVADLSASMYDSASTVGLRTHLPPCMWLGDAGRWLFGLPSGYV